MNDEMNNSDKDKTFIFNQGNNDAASKGEATNQNAENSEKALRESKVKTNTDKKSGINPGIFAAGVGAAGIAGVAAGAVFSEEIKDVFTPDLNDTSASNPTEVADAGVAQPEIAQAEVSQASIFGNSDAPVEKVSENAVNVESDSPKDLSPESPVGDNSLHMEFSNSEGHYEITMHDANNDHQIDSMSVDVELVDGSHACYTVSGTLLDDALHNEHVELAQSSDYLEHVSSGTFENFTPESLGASGYEIQYGDTLSELAQANNTTVAHIMELNPQIDNPNVIYAGDQIVIPTGDHASNPYAGWNPEWSQETTDVIQEHNIEHVEHDSIQETEFQDYEGESGEEVQDDQIYEAEGEYENYGEEIESADGEYQNVDWQSFEDQPVDDYSQSFGNEDFDQYESPESYFEASNDLDSLSFC